MATRSIWITGVISPEGVNGRIGIIPVAGKEGEGWIGNKVVFLPIGQSPVDPDNHEVVIGGGIVEVVDSEKIASTIMANLQSKLPKKS